MQLFSDIPWSNFINKKGEINFEHELSIFSFKMGYREFENLEEAAKESGTKLKDKIYELFNSELKDIYRNLIYLANALEFPLEMDTQKSEYTTQDIKNLYNKIITIANNKNLVEETIFACMNLDNKNENSNSLLKLLTKANALNKLGLMSNTALTNTTKNIVINMLKNYEKGTQPFDEIPKNIISIVLNVTGEELSSTSKNYLDEASQESLIETGLITKKIDPNTVKKIKSKINIIFFKSPLSSKTKVEVIYSPILLELLSALLKPNAFIEFLNSLNTITISKEAYRVLLGNIADSYYFCDKVPVLTVLKLLNEVPKKDLKPFEGETILNLLDLYNELKAYLPVDEEEIIPPGIRRFECSKNCECLYNYSNKLFKKSKTKSIKFFPGLNRFSNAKKPKIFDDDNYFEKISIITITDDIENLIISKPLIGGSTFRTTIVIQPNVKRHNIFAPGNNVSLEFIDYQNSGILNSQNMLTDTAYRFLNEFSDQSEIILKQEGSEPVVITRQDIEAKAKFKSDKKYQEQILIEEIRKHLNKSNTKSASL